jgi:hypothetical protein
MKTTTRKSASGSRRNARQPATQPKPFTPGVTAGMVRQHAYAMFRDKLPGENLTLEDWVLAEKDLVQDIQTENLPMR